MTNTEWKGRLAAELLECFRWSDTGYEKEQDNENYKSDKDDEK